MTPLSFDRLETERLILRLPNEQDFGALCDFYASDRAKHVGGPMTPEQVWRTLAVEVGHWPLRGYGRFALEHKQTGQTIGMIGPWFPHGWPEPEVGWDIMNGFEGQGYASEAARACLTHVFRTLKWPTAISLIAVENEGSRRLAQRMGAHHDGEFTHERFGHMQIWRHSAPERGAA